MGNPSNRYSRSAALLQKALEEQNAPVIRAIDEKIAGLEAKVEYTRQQAGAEAGRSTRFNTHLEHQGESAERQARQTNTRVANSQAALNLTLYKKAKLAITNQPARSAAEVLATFLTAYDKLNQHKTKKGQTDSLWTLYAKHCDPTSGAAKAQTDPKVTTFTPKFEGEKPTGRISPVTTEDSGPEAMPTGTAPQHRRARMS